MSNPHSLPDYKDRYFETKSLDCINGKPTLQKIIKIFCQLKRNAQKVPTRLGGGNHGYLALLYKDPKYNLIPGTAQFNRPTDPGIFSPTNITIAAASTGVATRTTPATPAAPTTRPPNSAELTQQKANYDDRLCLFLEVETVERLLSNQLIKAFDDDYVQALRDANDVISFKIPDIMEYLVKTYGQLKPEELRHMKSEVEEYIYDPSLPIDVLFNKMDFFCDVVEFVEKSISDADRVDMIYIILNRCGVFCNSLNLEQTSQSGSNV